MYRFKLLLIFLRYRSIDIFTIRFIKKWELYYIVLIYICETKRMENYNLITKKILPNIYMRIKKIILGLFSHFVVSSFIHRILFKNAPFIKQKVYLIL